MKKNYADFLLVSDMDGTLLNSSKEVSAENRAAIADFVAGGGRFAIATGRPAANAAGYLTGVPVNSPGIFFNGAMLYDWQTAKLLAACPLEGQIWRDFAAHCCRRFIARRGSIRQPRPTCRMVSLRSTASCGLFKS